MIEPRPISLFNTLTRRVEPVTPLVPGELKVYNCGPTIYDYVHIGNLRTFLFQDLARRVFETAGYRVVFCLNLTDVDDKIIRDSQKALPADADNDDPPPGDAGVHRHLRACVPRRHRRAPDRPAHADAPRHRPHGRHDSARPGARGPRSGLRAGRQRLLPGRRPPAVRLPVAHRPRGDATRNQRGRGRVRPRCDQRLRSLEGRESRRAVVGQPMGPGTARMAHRVFGDGADPARRAARPPHRGRGPRVPAPRERDRAERGRHRPPVGLALGARRVPHGRGAEDVQESGQLLHAPGAGRRRASIR